MCGGGGSSAPAPVDTYRGPPGPGENIGNVPLGQPNYQQQAESLLSMGQTYGQLASGIVSQLQQQQPMAAPPAPQSAFDGGIGQYIAGQASRPVGPSPAMQGLTAFESTYDPRTSALEMLQGYEGTEAQPMSFYTPQSISSMGKPPEPDDEEDDPLRRVLNRFDGGTGGGGAGSMGGGQF